jgi:redox-sensitive bicupin YhaK (pirin superfamily)
LAFILMNLPGMADPTQARRSGATLRVRKAGERGRTDWGWLDSRHTFSFGEYNDPKHVAFRSLRVINDDRVAPGGGFGTHGHRDMEILSYVLEGGLEHKDSSGGGGVIRPGEIQFMRAGSGVTHSEYNASKTEPVHFLQIWIVPDQRGLAPRYDQKPFDVAAARRGFVTLASREGESGAIQVSQDVTLSMTFLAAGERREHALAPGRSAWLHVARGRVRLAGEELGEGDGVALTDEPGVVLEGLSDAEVLLFDLA